VNPAVPEPRPPAARPGARRRAEFLRGGTQGKPWPGRNRALPSLGLPDADGGAHDGNLALRLHPAVADALPAAGGVAGATERRRLLGLVRGVACFGKAAANVPVMAPVLSVLHRPFSATGTVAVATL
jgi:hypothetical protein